VELVTSAIVDIRQRVVIQFRGWEKVMLRSVTDVHTVHVSRGDAASNSARHKQANAA
jgi:hypothetical protein